MLHSKSSLFQKLRSILTCMAKLIKNEALPRMPFYELSIPSRITKTPAKAILVKLVIRHKAIMKQRAKYCNNIVQHIFDDPTKREFFNEDSGT